MRANWPALIERACIVRRNGSTDRVRNGCVRKALLSRCGGHRRHDEHPPLLSADRSWPRLFRRRRVRRCAHPVRGRDRMSVGGDVDYCSRPNGAAAAALVAIACGLRAGERSGHRLVGIRVGTGATLHACEHGRSDDRRGLVPIVPRSAATVGIARLAVSLRHFARGGCAARRRAHRGKSGGDLGRPSFRPDIFQLCGGSCAWQSYLHAVGVAGDDPIQP